MPLLQIRQLNNHTLLGIWHLTESPEDLAAGLPPQLSPETIATAHPKRQREWMASRILAYTLLRHFTQASPPLLRDGNGKPYFDTEKPLYLSITHSPELAAVILSDKYEVGIDVELISGKALRVADKFLADTEGLITAGEVEKTCLYWSTKETLYKLYSKRKLIFKENLLMTPLADKANILEGRVQTESFSKLYYIHYETILNHILTYSTDDSLNPTI